jgi:hypothetical protein
VDGKYKSTESVLKAKSDVFGKRHTHKYRKALNIWNEEISSIIGGKGEAYFRHLHRHKHH